MRFNRLPGLVIMILLMVNMVACNKPALPALQPGDVVVAFGDSLTKGYGVNEKQSYPQVLQSLTGHTVINAGVTGELTSEGRLRFAAVLQKYQPKLVILLEGGNDILQNVPKEQTYQNLQAMVQLAKQNGVAIVLVGVPEKKLFANTAELYDELANNENILLEDDIVASLMRRPSMKSDFVHFNANGYRALAQAIFNVLQSNGAI